MSTSPSTRESAEENAPASRRSLSEVFVDQSSHLEHRDLLLAAEDLLEVVVGVDHPFVRLILKTVGLDVVPDFLGHFAARYRLASDDECQVGTRLHFGLQSFSFAAGRFFSSCHESFPFAFLADCGLARCARQTNLALDKGDGRRIVKAITPR